MTQSRADDEHPRHQHDIYDHDDDHQDHITDHHLEGLMKGHKPSFFLRGCIPFQVQTGSAKFVINDHDEDDKKMLAFSNDEIAQNIIVSF